MNHNSFIHYSPKLGLNEHQRMGKEVAVHSYSGMHTARHHGEQKQQASLVDESNQTTFQNRQN